MTTAASKARVLCLIPAKGGSTRLPRKNILPLGDKPLIAWTLKAARDSGIMQRIVVSTEDEEVAQIARQWGAEVPFSRPDDLARDPAGVVQVGLHCLQELRRQGEEYNVLIILLPTCPFRTAQDIRDAYELFQQKQGRFLMSVAEYPHTPFAALMLDEGHLSPYFPQYSGKKSQEMPLAYRPNGAIHILDVPAFEQAKSYYAQPLLAFPMPAERSVDIDNAFDLAIARCMLSAPLP